MLVKLTHTIMWYRVIVANSVPRDIYFPCFTLDGLILIYRHLFDVYTVYLHTCSSCIFCTFPLCKDMPQFCLSIYIYIYTPSILTSPNFTNQRLNISLRCLRKRSSPWVLHCLLWWQTAWRIFSLVCLGAELRMWIQGGYPTHMVNGACGRWWFTTQVFLVKMKIKMICLQLTVNDCESTTFGCFCFCVLRVCCGSVSQETLMLGCSPNPLRENYFF